MIKNQSTEIIQSRTENGGKFKMKVMEIFP